MTRRLLALGSLAAVAAIVAVAVLLTTRARHEQPSATPAARHEQPSATPARTLATPSFTAPYPAAWHLTTLRAHGATRSQLSSSGRPIDGLGIGPAGTVGVTVEESAPSARLAAFRGSMVALLAFVVGTPRQARDITLAAPPRSVSLDGAPAAEESYAYTFAGRQNVQSDVIARRGERLLFIELDAEPAAARAGAAGFAMLTGRWRWR